MTHHTDLGVIKGLWNYLITRNTNRHALELERERNRAYAEHRDRLRDGTELMDYQTGQGRTLWIRKTGPSVPAPLPLTVVIDPESAPAVEFLPVQDSGPAGELDDPTR